jgi:thiol:disulfide interchange protein DsbD
MLRTALAMTALFAATTCAAQGLSPLPGAPRDLVRAELRSDVLSIKPGSSFRLGVLLTMKDGWHVNWTNPGDAGLAPSIKWKLPAGFKAGIVAWPLPSRIMTGPIAIFGYAGTVLLVSEVHVPADVQAGGNVEFAADVSWLACAEECVPGSASVHLALPIEGASRPDPEAGNTFEVTATRWPGHSRAWRTEAWIEEANTLVLEIQSGDATSKPLQDLFFFPYEPGLVDNAAPQQASIAQGRGGSVYQLRIARSRMPAAELTRVYGLLVASSGLSRAEGPAAIEVDVPISRR